MRRSGRSSPSCEPHRAAEPRIGIAFRRPGAFDKAAKHNAVAFGETRFEKSENAHAKARPRRAAHDAPGKGCGEKLDIFGRRNGQAGGGFATREFVERVCKSLAIAAGERGLGALAARQRSDNVAMARGEIAQGMGFAPETFERL